MPIYWELLLPREINVSPVLGVRLNPNKGIEVIFEGINSIVDVEGINDISNM